MNSDLSMSPAAPVRVRSRYFTVRFFKSIFRFLFSLRMVWLLVILVSLVVLLYQYENWNGARELRDVRARMIARAGTADFRTLQPAIVPEEENFFAIPVIKSWREPTDNKDVAGGYTHKFPGTAMLPDKYDPPQELRTPGRSVLDWAAWEKKRVKAGKPVPAGQSPAAVVKAEIGDSQGVLPQLIAGLDRPSSQAMPCWKAGYEAAGGDILKTGLPAFSAIFTMQEALALHLRTAALTDDAAKTRDVAGVMLRLGSAFSDSTILANLVGIAVNNVTLSALNEALECRTLTDQDLRKITEWLSVTNDVAQVESMFRFQMLATDEVFNLYKSSGEEKRPTRDRWLGSWRDRNDFTAWQFTTALTLGPSGWWDSNHAFFLENAVLSSGEPGDEGWRAGAKGAETAERRTPRAAILYAKGDFMLLNPRRSLAALHAPAFHNFWNHAADNLFRRRCAILTCALRRHRLAHGTFPATLAELGRSLVPSPQTDPAKAGAPMGYRLTDKGFLIWSVGADRNDDGGDADKDWQWYHDVN
jgi:hypothetical protein